ncbi:hypothetical protein CQW23_27902 [Capsicum baccatum]|uniref:Uncharacterized protein n=1 Tax=Capsicum baccatum TaxID=33114 RepID=A0A2G2VEZ3_CAPBA|nr:hypothetical protein CQW23_27902 [Capsicum baccatum]
MRAGVYEWVVDRHTVVEPVTYNGGMEVSLPLPTKLNTVPFSAIERLRPGVEFDLLAVVADCSALQYTADQSKHFREAIVIDQSRLRGSIGNNLSASLEVEIWTAYILPPPDPTRWEYTGFVVVVVDYLADNEGATLLHHLHEHPVILAKRIGVTEFRGAIRLATRYQTSILLNPKYVQAATLIKWVEDNEHMLVSYTLRSSLASPSSPNLAPVEDEVFPISTISELSSQTFPVEGKISLPDRLQLFYLLACSHCNHFVRIKTKNGALLQLRHFELNITNTRDTITATVSETVAQTMLSLTSNQIYENVATQREPLSIVRTNQQFAHRLFRLQLQKLSYRFPNQTPGMLAVTSFTEAENPVVQTLSSPMAPGETGGVKRNMLLKRPHRLQLKYDSGLIQKATYRKNRCLVVVVI